MGKSDLRHTVLGVDHSVIIIRRRRCFKFFILYGGNDPPLQKYKRFI